MSRKTPPPRSNTMLYVGIAVALALAAGLVWAYAARDAPERAAYTPVSDFSHVHGLAVDPDDARVLYVATHHGLVRGTNGSAWELVGASRDDFMGFMAHPEDGGVMWSSGHPEQATVSYHNLGVRVSRDAGLTWEDLALPGVDFHAMTVSAADPDRLWGHYGGELKRSDDGGRSWSAVAGAPRAVAALAADPADADALWAATADGIARSEDGGATWARASDTRAVGLATDPSDARTLYAATGAGVARTADGGATWETLALRAQVTHVTVSPHDARVIYAASSDGAIHRSADAGGSWATLKPASRLE